MRNKDNKFDVAAGLNFDASDEPENEMPMPAKEKTKEVTEKITSKKSEISEKEEEPKKRGRKKKVIYDELEERTQFTFCCSKGQYNKYMEYAKKDRRRLSDFICIQLDDLIDKWEHEGRY